MPQRKLNKRAKKTSTIKHTVKQDVLTLIAKIEAEFRHVPNRLVALCRQEQEKLKHHEKKIALALKKATTQQKTLEKKQRILTNKQKPATKKQLSQAKKSITENTKSIKLIEKQKQQTTKMHELLAHKKAKFSILGKELIQIEKKLKAQKPLSSKKKNSTKPVRLANTKKEVITPQSPGDSTRNLSLEFANTDFSTKKSS